MVKIYIENEILEFKNNANEIGDILNKIDNIVNNSSKILSYMTIDSIEVYENYYDYFLDNIRVIEEVKVNAMTYKELVHDTLISTLDYIKNSTEQIEELANSFYRNPDGETWKNLNHFLGGISWIINTFASIDNNLMLKDLVSSYEGWNLYAKEVFSLQEILVDFEEALSNSDNISIADIISYEILPIFNRMAEKILDLIRIY